MVTLCFCFFLHLRFSNLMLLLLHKPNRDHSFCTYVKLSEKLTLLIPDMHTYQGLRNVWFSENFVCVLNKWSHMWKYLCTGVPQNNYSEKFAKSIRKHLWWIPFLVKFKSIICMFIKKSLHQRYFSVTCMAFFWRAFSRIPSGNCFWIRD